MATYPLGSKPSMDRLTHAVIKETSKNLRHYVDVRRREDGFVLSPSASVSNSLPTRARSILGTSKRYPSLYSSCHTDFDVKNYLRIFQQHPKRFLPTSNSPERQMCREELKFHMHSLKSPPKEKPKFADLRLGHPRRSTSSCSSREIRSRLAPQSSGRSTRSDENKLVDDTATILGSLMKARRTAYETDALSHQTAVMNHVARTVHPFPHPLEEHSNTKPMPSPVRIPVSDVRPSDDAPPVEKPKVTTENAQAKAASIMKKAKPVKNSIFCEYKITVTTGTRNGASTDGPISIKLYGTKGYVDFAKLTESKEHRVPFRKGQKDTFVIRTLHVGRLVGITIGHDQKDIRASWYLDEVSIDDPIRTMTFQIPCNVWLSSKSDDQKTMRDFQVDSVFSNGTKIDSNGGHEELECLSDATSTTASDQSTDSSDTNRTQLNFTNKEIRRREIHRSHTFASHRTASASRVKSPIQSHETLPPPPPKIPPSTPKKTQPPSSPDTEIEDYAMDFSSPKDAGSPSPPSSRKQSVSNPSPVKMLVDATRPAGSPKPWAAQHTAAKPILRRNSPPLPRLPQRTEQSKPDDEDNDGDSFFD